MSAIHIRYIQHSCEAWSLTLREEDRLRVFENRILRQIFGSKRDENGSGEGSTMKNFSLYRSPNIVRVIVQKTEMGRSCSQNGRRQECFQNFSSYVCRKEALRRPRHRWKDNIRMDLTKIGINTRNWVANRDQMRALVNVALNLWVP